MQYEQYTFTTPWDVDITVYTRPGTNDWNTLYSCITEDEYKVGSLDHSSNSNAVDIGAHAGGCSLALLSRGFNVLAVEPLPENAELIMKNVEANGWSDRFTLHNKAISDKSNKTVILRYGNENTESGSHHRFIGNTIDSDSWQENLWTDGKEIKVKTICIDELLQDIDSVSLLKIDCEGAEWNAFKGASKDSLDKIEKVVAELHAVPEFTNTDAGMYNEFHNLIGDNFKNRTHIVFKDVQNYETIGLAYFEK